MQNKKFRRTFGALGCANGVKFFFKLLNVDSECAVDSNARKTNEFRPPNY